MKVMDRLKDDRGATSYVLMLVVMMVATVLLSFSLEFFQAFALRDKVKLAIERAGNMAVSISMRDDYRIERLHTLDPDMARNEFLEYIATSLDLSGAYPGFVYNGDGLNYELRFSEIAITETPPRIRSSAEISVSPITSAWWIPEGMVINLPVSTETRNIRLD